MLQGTLAQNATVTWPLTANANATVPAGLTAAMTKGNGLTNGGYGTNGYTIKDAITNSLNNAKTANDYIQFSVTVNATNTFSISGLVLKTLVPANQANARFQVQYSFSSNFAAPANIGTETTPAAAITTTTFNPSNLQVPAGSTIYIRIFTWGLSATNTDFTIKDVQVLGSVCPSVAITYPAPGAYCKTPGATAMPTRTGPTGGVYTAPAGLVINSSTGVIDVAASVAGTYTVSYTVAGGSGCGNLVATKSVVINNLPTAFTLTGPDGATGSFCTNGTPATFTLSGSEEGVTYTFTAINPGGNTPPGQNFSVEGVGGTLEFVQTPDGKWSYKVIGEDTETGCSNTMEGLLTAVDGPKVTSQPEPIKTVCSGSTVALTVAVSNANSLAWEVSPNGVTGWTPLNAGGQYAITKNGNNSTTLTISNVTVGLNGYRYRTVFGGPAACPINYSNGTTLSVSAIPEVTAQPVSKAVCLNSTFQVSVAALHATSYQWYKNGTLLTGETAPTLTRNFTSTADAGAYYVMIYGTCGSKRSNDANISANTNPASTTWLGPTASTTPANGTAWEFAPNWTCGVPTRTKDAIIPADVLDGYPTIKATITGEVRNLTIQSGVFGGFLNVEGKLQLFGTVTNTGVFEAGNGTIEYSGTTVQSISANTFANNTVKNLVISNNVTLNGPLDLTGTLSFGAVNSKTFTTNDHLALKSSAAATARVADITNNGVNAGNSITGNVSVERFIPAHSSRRWRLVTAPVKGVSINKAWQEGRTWNGSGASEAQGYGTLITGQAQGTPEKANAAGFDFWTAIAGGGASVRKYVGSSSASSNIDAAFFPIDNTTTASFTSHEAYLLFVRGDRTISSGSAVGSATLRAKGPLKQETTYTIPVATTQSHTLIGNPYASPINFRKLYTDNSSKIQPYYWTWQAGLGSGVGGYVLMFPNGEGGWEPVPATSGAGTTEPVIASGEGFFVVPAAGATTGNTIQLKEVHKDGNKPSISTFRQADAAPAKVRINLFTSINGQQVLLDGVQARFSESEKTAMQKAVNGGENLSIYKNSKDLIVAGDALPAAGDSIQLRFWNLAVRKYTLELAGNRFPAGTAAVLYDRHLAKETPIQLAAEGLVYEFAVTADAGSKAAQRFVIRFQKAQVLPVTLLSFTAKEESNSTVGIEWKVTGENNIKDYTVEHSTDGSIYKPLQTVLPTGQATDQVYGTTHGQPASVNHYRLKITEATGSIRYSGVATVRLDLKEGATTVYPNPVRGSKAFIKLSNKPAGNYSLAIYNPAGQQVLATVLVHGGGTAALSLPLNSNWAEGIYTVRLTNSKGGVETISLHLAK
ncbi:T9SS type A sorting domain-containing protein [Flavisolibacter sp. BT320]|nr:T9SS type A sorting domain-containing protein [Flavisolibacter longurius]